ncbi:MAG TPA: T9SS type A sorting domain-containing protein, partial [Bacteroidetes bacterium]|nr:T9SS type A sorting domain-containing protein [Bacteroidota bacterium]
VEVDNVNRTALLSWNTGEQYFADSFEDGTFDAWEEHIMGPGTPGDDQVNAFWYVKDAGNAPDGTKIAHSDWGYGIDTWIISKPLLVTAGTTLSFWWNTSYYWHVSPYDNGDLHVKISNDGGNSWTSLWTENDEGTFNNFVWYETVLDLSAYQGSVQIAFNFVSNDGATYSIDNVVFGNSGKKLGTFARSNAPSVISNAKSVNGFNYEFFNPKTHKSFVGFNVYLDGAETPLNAEPIEGTTYLIEDLAYDVHTASVEAVYTTGVSNKVSIGFTLTQPIIITYGVVGENGTLTATADGNAIDSGEEVPFGADLVFTATPNSGYKVKEWTVNGSTFTGFLETTLSIDDVQQSTTVTVEFDLISGVNIGTLTDVKAYPNPFNDYITVSNSTMVKRVTVTNIIGQTVLDINYTGEPINTSVLSTGVYLISFEGINGERMVQKMIKK